jgi:serine phosphatase RsbU (regulator of sigma subunit)
LYIFSVLIPFIDEEILLLIFNKYFLENILSSEFMLPLAFSFYALFILEYFKQKTIKFVKFIRFYYKFTFSAVSICLALRLFKIEGINNFELALILPSFLMTIIAYVLILINAIFFIGHNYKPAIYILIGNTIVLIGMILSFYYFSQVSYYDEYSFLSYTFIFSIFLEALIFSIGITDQINMLQKEVEKEQKASIETLENKVEERTVQLKQEKEKVEYQKQEILDSIEYAKRIQTAILPPPRIVKEFLKNSFVLYLPKDIVAGDFYWMESMDEKIYFAACDCTGHGVPGAMVSVVCNNALNRALNEFGERDPAKLFDKTRELVLENFAKSDEEVQDGMDASLAVLNVETKEMLWSGANNPLWIYRTKSNFIEEIKADKQPIGKGYENKPFTTHKVDLNEGDIIYLFTDGYSDQFGGDKGRKLTKSKFKDLLLKIANLPMEKQREELLSFHDKYRGIEEQVDDICIIGVRV